MAHPGSAPEVFLAFLRLGLTSFGGPVAHLGYFRQDIVAKRGWLSEAGYGELVALCQFLPGPASSQVGIGIGLLRAGPLGALAAWTAFTLPSALLLLLFAFGLSTLESLFGTGWVHGLKLAAVAVVAQAVWSMARSLTPDRQRLTLALAVTALLLFWASPWAQIVAMLSGGLIGLLLYGKDRAAVEASSLAVPLSRRTAIACFTVFLALLGGLPLLAWLIPSQALDLISAFYRAGSLVFGGGHVVLPLLEASVVTPGWVDQADFLAGYGAAQAVPGPLFTFAAYLGAVMGPEPSGVAGAAIALVAIFLPSFLLVFAALPFWQVLRQRPGAQAVLKGVNAAVVGLLLAALYDPVFLAGVLEPRDFAIAAGALLLLEAWRLPPWLVVLLSAVAGAVLTGH
ncbi:MAG: chromate efflux transporter [Rhodospirillales bacterium]